MSALRERVLGIARAALAAIEAERERIDDLNVYPVPDGDTGTNLALSLRALAEGLEQSAAEEREALSHQAVRAALMGARGNSGVILSQIVRGAAESLRTSDDLAAALRAGSDAAYRAVRAPVEGTMLTAIRALADEAEAGSGLEAIIARGEACVAATREMLPVLTEAGVVDAGAAGLVVIARGIAAALAGEQLALPAAAVPAPLGIETHHHELSLYRYCTVFLVEGEGIDADALERSLEPLGDSLLVVGDPSAVKVHVHTDDPGAALSLGVTAGALSGVEIADMHAQTRAREERLLQPAPAPAGAAALVAVAAGAGNRRLFESLGADVVDGGRTMNPSCAEIVAVLDATGASEVLLLPNDRNVLLTAQQAAHEAAASVSVVPTTTLQAGLAAAVAFDPDAPAAVNVALMTRAAEDVATGAVTIASRELASDGVVVGKGGWLGLADGTPVAGGGSFDEVAGAVAERLLETPRGILTLLSGEEPQPLERLVAELGRRYPGLELEVHDGGQPHYALLLSAE